MRKNFGYENMISSSFLKGVFKLVNINDGQRHGKVDYVFFFFLSMIPLIDFLYLLFALDSLDLAILISILRAEEKEKCQYCDIRRYFY